MGLIPLAQLPDRGHIVVGSVELPITAFFVKRKIQKKYFRQIEAENLTGSARLRLSNQSLELAQSGTVLVKGSLFLKLIGQSVQAMRSLGVRRAVNTQLAQKTDGHPGFV